MAKHPHTGLFALAFVLVGGLVTLVFVVRDDDGARGDLRPVEVEARAFPAPNGGLRGPAQLVPPPRVASTAGEAWNEPTTVLWPCRVELDLLQASYLPTEARVPPIGTGRSARLSGRIATGVNGGVRATVTFVAGPNEGRMLACDSTGSFGATDLYPGLAVVEVTGPGIVGARREVRLRQNAETLLNIGFGLPGSAQGKVVDRKGDPVQGAKVTLDGQTTYSGVEGEFYFANVASGHCVTEVEHPDYATLLDIVSVSAGRPMPPGRLLLALHPAVSMSVSTPSPVGGPGPTLVYVLAGSSHSRGVVLQQRERRYPWHRLNPIEVQPGSPTLIENLPAEVIRVMAFRPGAVAREQVVNLREGRVTPVQIHLQPAPMLTGVVTLDGKALPGVELSLEAPDRVRANLGYLRESSRYLESEVMSYLPPSRQQTVTGREGRYVLSAWDDVAGVRYLEARGPQGNTWAGRLVHPGETRVDLELETVALGDSSLDVLFPGRHQGLPLEVVINGNPQDPYVLAPLRDLRVEALVSGTWKLRVTWHGDEIFRSERLDLDGETEARVGLPIEAVEGQDEEAWKRAGRDWPL